MNTLSDEQLKELMEQYKANGLGYIKYIEGPVTFNEGTQDQILTVSEVSLLVRLHNTFPAILSTIQSLSAELAAAKETNKTLADELEFIKAHSAIPSPACNYLSPAGMTCFKCGKVHSGTRLSHALSQPPQSPWRPLAEAPKDGTTLLLYPSRFTLKPCVGFYNSLSGHWVAETDTAWPTHWMPLPQPPTKGGDES